MSYGNWNHDFEVGDTVYFNASQFGYTEGEIIAIHGPWLWLTDGGGMYTEHYDNCSRDPDEVPEKQEAIW